MIILFFVVVVIGLQVQLEYFKFNFYFFKVNQEDDGSISFIEFCYLIVFNFEGFNNDFFFFSNIEFYIFVKELGVIQFDFYKFDLEN